MQANSTKTEPGPPARLIHNFRLPVSLIATGVSLLLAGFIYHVVFAGIPYQDPTPEMSARYARHAAIASMLFWCGAGAFVAGFLWGAIRLPGAASRRMNGAILLSAVLFGPMHGQAQGFLDYERDIGDGYQIFRANSLEVCIAKSGGSIVLHPRDYPQVGPVVEYATTPELILTKNIGRKPRNRFAGDTLDELDHTKSFCFIIQKGTDKVTGPLSPAELADHPLVRPLGKIRWQEPSNPIFGLPLLGIAIVLLLLFAGASYGLYRLVRSTSRRNAVAPPKPFAEINR
jgi:hypothetical protein